MEKETTKTVPWNEIEADYIRGEYKNQDLADKYSISKNTLENRAKNNKWVQKKTDLNRKIQKEVEKKIIKAEVNRTQLQLELADAVRELIRKELLKGISNPDFNPSSLKALTSSLLDLQKVERTAEGLDKETQGDNVEPEINFIEGLDNGKI